MNCKLGIRLTVGLGLAEVASIIQQVFWPKKLQIRERGFWSGGEEYEVEIINALPRTINEIQNLLQDKFQNVNHRITFTSIETEYTEEELKEMKKRAVAEAL